MRRLVLLLPLLIVACERPDQRPGLKPGEVLLQVAATGRAEATPDEARIVIGFSNNGASASAASASNAATMERVSNALAALGVTPTDIQTRNLSLQRIEYGPQRGQFRAENLVEVRLREVNRAGAAIAAATEAGGNVVAGPNLRISDPEKADNGAYAAAYKASRARAEAYAQAAGLKVRRVMTIRDGSVPLGPMPYVGDGVAVEEAAGRIAAAPPVSAGSTTREARVRVDFVLGN
jgi:hypothetical protein